MLAEPRWAVWGLRLLPILGSAHNLRLTSCSCQLLLEFLQPAEAVTRRNWTAGHSNSGLCASLSPLALTSASAFPTQLMTATSWTGGGCGKEQISWTQAAGEAADTREVHGFPSSTSLHMSYAATKALQTCTASASVGPRASKRDLHIRSQELMLDPCTDWSNLGAKSIECKWK